MAPTRALRNDRENDLNLVGVARVTSPSERKHATRRTSMTRPWVPDTTADKTRESIYLTLQLVFALLADPAAAAAVLPGHNDQRFDVGRFCGSEERCTCWRRASDTAGWDRCSRR